MNLYITSRFNMNNVKRLFVAALLCYVVGNVRAQEPQGDPFQYNPSEKMFLPTPEQASLLKFTNIPAGNHTGVFGYSIPIYTIEGKAFSLPISIDYHGMGIKVNELSGSVGIGWALNLGGISLSEEVRGERDQSITKLNYFDVDSFLPEETPPNQDYLNGLSMLGLGPGGPQYTPDKELHPDYYCYSLLNNSGRFMLDNDSKPHTIPKDNVKITGNNSFVITDSKGLIYHFSIFQQENANYGNGMNGNGGIVENRKSYGHKLDYIEIPHTGETITFEYYEVSYGYFSSHTVTNKIYFNQSGVPITIPGGSNTYGTVTEYLPKSITYNYTKVEFNYKRDGINPSKFLDREDVDNIYDNNIIGDAGGILEYIEVTDLSNDLTIKQYKLLTDYFVSDNESLPDLELNYDKTPWKKRLKLEGIQDLINDTDYEFEYYGESEGKALPPRFSFKTDYWGMYNGKNNNTELNYFTILHAGEVFHFSGADKKPDINFAKTGSLKKVKLPTGGSQSFEYELDKFKNTVFDDDDTVFNPVYNYQEREHIIDQTIVYNDPDYDEIILNITPPAPDFREGISHKLLYYTGYEPPSYTPPDGIPTETCYYAQLFENNSAITNRIYVSGEYDLPQLDPTKSYSFRIFKHPGTNENIGTFNIQFTLKWIDENVTYPQNREAGTLRVKTITLNDANGNAQIKRSYNYDDFDTPALSSGKFTGRQLTPYYVSDEPEKGSVYNITNNDIYNLTSAFGKSVVYENVTETYESTDPSESSKNHKKEYIFSLPYTAGFPVYSKPLSPFPHNDYTGGLLLEERVKNNQNQLVAVTRNQYNYENPDYFFNQFSANYYSPYNFALSPALLISMGRRETYELHPFDINFYHLTSAWIKLKKTTVDEYENGTRVRTNFTEYTYNENTGAQNEFKSILPVSVTTRTSMAKDDETYMEKLKIVYKYPQDLVGVEQTPFMQNLKDANRISDPVITEKYIVKSGTETKLSELHMKYGANLLPSEVHYRSEPGNIDINSTADRKVRYSRYDTSGNIEEFIMEDDTPVSIIWGYNKQFPIAKVEGIGFQAIEDDIDTFDLVNLSNADDDHCLGTNNQCSEADLRKALNDFRNTGTFNGVAAENVMVTTYTYDPLLGITSITQPNGQVEYYKYDTAGRLEYIHDKDLNVIKNMRYNYKD